MNYPQLTRNMCKGVIKIKGLDLTNKRFGRLTVIKYVETDKNRKKLWLCRCDCGNKKIVPTTYLTSGDTTSCGCYRKECELINLSKFWGKHKTHGLSKTRIYQIWADMKDRCNNKNNQFYKNYGKRGIKVCEDWSTNFMNFYNWAINNGYTSRLTIDRIDVNGNYEPNNCRWATRKIQANNTRVTRKIVIYGEKKSAYEFEKQYGIKAHTLIDRYNKGYRDDKLIYKGNLGHFRKTNLKRDSKGRFIKKEEANVL